LVSDDIVEEQFICNLNVCKGACCIEGDLGAPLEEEETAILEKIYPDIKDILTPQSRDKIAVEGLWQYSKKEGYTTSLMNDGACVYLIYDELGIAKCGIEEAHRQGLTDFLKPISCHLYPIRVSKLPGDEWEALNYHKWDICKAACALGKEHKVPIYRFLKNALVRAYGEDFYEELDAAAEYLKSK